MLNKIAFFSIVCIGIASQFFCSSAQDLQKKISVVVPSYNNAEWYIRNLDSIFIQEYDNYHVYYIDDVSSDNTAQLVEDYIDDHGLHDKCTLIKNSKRTGALFNLYKVIHACDDGDIIITIDGDDWLKDPYVFARINKVYLQEDVWLTYGQFEGFPNGVIGMCRDYPAVVRKNNLYREYDWITSHLRTFYAGLFKRIKTTDLFYKGAFFQVAWDLAMMFPMLEMAGGRIKCIKEVLYVYNIQTPLNDFKLRAQEQRQCDRFIRLKQKYQSIPTLDASYDSQQTLSVAAYEALVGRN